MPFRFLALLLALALLPACANFGKKNQGSAGDYAGSDSDYVTGTPLPDRQEGLSWTSPSVDRERFAPVMFGFDSASVSAGERGKVAAVAEHLRDSGGAVIVAGFTDERGTPEYNRALGERRALVVREALIRAGADADRVQTVSFGADNPADPGSGEGAWARNRRAEFGVSR